MGLFVFLYPLFIFGYENLSKHRLTVMALQLEGKPSEKQKQFTKQNLEIMYTSINSDLSLVKIINIIFDESYFFINFGLNIFFERINISTGLYRLEDLLHIHKDNLLDIEMLWDSFKVIFDFVAEFSITFFIFKQYTLVTVF